MKSLAGLTGKSQQLVHVIVTKCPGDLLVRKVLKILERKGYHFAFLIILITCSCSFLGKEILQNAWTGLT